MLTKSNYLHFLQCPKYLWLEKYRKDLMAEGREVELKKIFEDGFAVERQAYRLFPSGVSAADEDFGRALARTEKLIRGGARLIFQPSFIAGDLYCRCDIVRLDGGGRAEIIEVKSSTEVKPEHISDLAFQKSVLEACGLEVVGTSVCRVDNQYVRKGEIDPAGLLKTEDVTDEVAELASEAAGAVRDALAVLGRKAAPDARIIRQCSDPHDCPFIGHCWKDLPARSIYEAGLAEEEIGALLDRGVIRLADVPEEMITKKRALRHYQAVRSGKPAIDRQAIAEWIGRLEYPLHFLDYETYAPAVPLFDGFRPYQRIPFQFSLDVVDRPGAPPRHFDFLAETLDDPTATVAATLPSLVGKKGNVVAWHMSFEQGCNAEIGGRLPSAAAFMEDVNSRMVDLKEPFSEGLFVHPDFGGSASLKSVLPVIVPSLSYDDLAIGRGGEAEAAWPELVAPATPAARKTEIKRALLEYCAQDTVAMIRILDVLERL